MDDRIKTAIKLVLIALSMWALWWIGNQWLAEYRMIQRDQEVSMSGDASPQSALQMLPSTQPVQNV